MQNWVISVRTWLVTYLATPIEFSDYSSHNFDINLSICNVTNKKILPKTTLNTYYLLYLIYNAQNHEFSNNLCKKLLRLGFLF